MNTARTTEYGGRQEALAWEAQEWEEVQGAQDGMHSLWFEEDAEEALDLLFEAGDGGAVSDRRVSVITALQKMPKAQVILLVRVRQGFTKTKASEMAGLNPTNQARNYDHALRAFINAYNGWPIGLSRREGIERRQAEREARRKGAEATEAA